MLNKFSILVPVLLISASITGCSGTKSQSNSALQTPNSSMVKTPTIKTAIKEKIKLVPVVFEKRSPAKRIQNRVQKPRYTQPKINNNSFAGKLSNAALGRLRHNVRYDGKYLKIGYPWGDVPPNIGVCTDVVIRSYRKLGIDLQSLVHQDISKAFNTYPNPAKWGLSKPDTNIDHRRVYNLRNFFQRNGAALPITRNPRDYKPGDIVTWMVGVDLPHIGVVVDRRTKADPNRYMIVHNIAHGPQIEDILFRFPITGHYRYTPAHIKNTSQNNKYMVLNQDTPQRNNSMTVNQLKEAAILLGVSM